MLFCWVIGIRSRGESRFVVGTQYRCLGPIVIPFAARYVEIFFGMMRYYAEFLGWFVAAVHTVATMTVAAAMILFLSCCSINHCGKIMQARW